MELFAIRRHLVAAIRRHRDALETLHKIIITQRSAASGRTGEEREVIVPAIDIFSRTAKTFFSRRPSSETYAFSPPSVRLTFGLPAESFFNSNPFYTLQARVPRTKRLYAYRVYKVRIYGSQNIIRVPTVIGACGERTASSTRRARAHGIYTIHTPFSRSGRKDKTTDTIRVCERVCVRTHVNIPMYVVYLSTVFLPRQRPEMILSFPSRVRYTRDLVV